MRPRRGGKERGLEQPADEPLGKIEGKVDIMREAERAIEHTAYPSTTIVIKWSVK